MDTQPSDEDVRRFILEETKKRVAYLYFIKAKGFTVDEEQISRFEQEIRDEEASLANPQ
ncbi:MAG TPA: hypothetical protein VGO68_15335 [Pyrinomonadaceae bacterium]|jgi:hypothetical protein|nr:hypothetical protein [Pyrinomonadaceae bacterium]